MVAAAPATGVLRVAWVLIGALTVAGPALVRVATTAALASLTTLAVIGAGLIGAVAPLTLALALAGALRALWPL